MLCIQKKIELDTGATAGVWIPLTCTLLDSKFIEVTLGGKVRFDSSCVSHALAVKVELHDVNLYEAFIQRIFDKMFADRSWPLYGARPGDKKASFMKKDVVTERKITAGVWGRRTFRIDYMDDTAYAAFDGYRDKQAMDEGLDPVTGHRPYVITIQEIASIGGFEGVQRQLLKHIVNMKGFELRGGRVADID